MGIGLLAILLGLVLFGVLQIGSGAFYVLVGLGLFVLGLAIVARRLEGSPLASKQRAGSQERPRQ